MKKHIVVMAIGLLDAFGSQYYQYLKIKAYSDLEDYEIFMQYKERWMPVNMQAKA